MKCLSSARLVTYTLLFPAQCLVVFWCRAWKMFVFKATWWGFTMWQPFMTSSVKKIMINSILFSQTNSVYIYQVPKKQGNCFSHNSCRQLVYHPIREVSVCPKNKQKSHIQETLNLSTNADSIAIAMKRKKLNVGTKKTMYIFFYC